MICFTNSSRLGGDPEIMNKHKTLIDKHNKLIALTHKLFKTAYEECKWRTPFTELELEFMEFKDETATIEEIYSEE
jgi:hypothetical protein